MYEKGRTFRLNQIGDIKRRDNPQEPLVKSTHNVIARNIELSILVPEEWKGMEEYGGI